MSHEIYYTSAPEGLKRGTSGFSTVGASDGIPKPLWDRLETLSAYRHQFAGGAGQNPVSWAHWILNLSGKTHHVLSRICDSGMDHTQRTNAFAHHLVVALAVLENAAGGPAWMLRQPGVMAEGWDGRVGAIGRVGLPSGDDYSSSKICRAWEGATGDAGWGGHLADLFAKSPMRPVCLLFSPGQDLFGLVEEAIALLPPAARWNVTFNTYFTSMPTSATCLWRCCLAGTQAAQIGLRYAASGLVLDLTDRSRLPALPAGAYVTMARTGQAVEAPKAAAKVAVHAPPSPNPVRSNAPRPPAEEFDDEELLEQQRRDNFFDFADAPETAAPAGAYDLSGDQTAEPALMPAAGTGQRQSGRGPARIMRRAEDALEAAERAAEQAAQRRRKQVMLLFAGAIGAIVLGTGLVIFMNSRSAPPEPPAKNAASRGQPATAEVAAVNPVVTQPVESTTEQTAAVTTAIAAVPAIPPPPAIVYPEIVTTQTMLERPNIGAGIGERVQMLALKAGDLDPAPVTGLKFAFPPTQSNKTPAPAGAAAYVNETLGTLTAQEEMQAGKPGITLRWKGPNDPSTEALFAGFDRTGPALEMRWKSSMLLKNPGSFSFIFWTLQNSVIELETAGAARQRIALKPFVPAAVSFTNAETNLSWPVELPAETNAEAPSADSLPAGWKAEWYPDWESKDPTQRKPSNALQVVKFKKATTTAAVDAWFLLTFSPGFKKVESTFAKRLDSDTHDLAQFESELRAVNAEIDDAKSRNNGTLGNSQASLDLQARHDETAALVEAYKAALAGYNELSKFDIALGLADGMQFTTLHFQARANQTGK